MKQETNHLDFVLFFLVVKSHNNSAAHFVPVRLFYVPPTLPQKKITIPLHYYFKNTKRDSCTGEKKNNKDFLL